MLKTKLIRANTQVVDGAAGKVHAVVSTYGNHANQAGVEQHLKKHLENTVNEYKRGQAADAVAEETLE